MANISGNGAPNKQTIGSVGDIYTNNNTGEQYECVAVYRLHSHKGVVTEYDWDLILYTNTGDGSGSGVSPTIIITEINGGHRIKITDINGSKSFDVMDGVDGEAGPQGAQGIQGVQGIQGENAVSAINPRGDYDVDADPAYTVNDYVTHTDGNTYVCKIDNPNNTAPIDGTISDPFWQLLALRGATGPQGIQGVAGKDGEDGVDGNDGVGIASVEKINTEGLVDTYRITFTDGTHFEYQVTNGRDGADGSDGSGADITVSEEAGNAIESKDDGIYVADKSAEIEAMSDKVSGISEYRKYVNTELEYCTLGFNTLDTHHTGTGDISSSPVVLDPTSVRGNIAITADNYVTLSAGKNYKISVTCRFMTNSTANSLLVGYRLYDINTGTPTMATGFANVNMNGKSTYGERDIETIMSPTEDTTITLCLTYVAGTVVNIAGSMTIQEVGRQITIDPLEHANSESGVEDAPVGHIISYMGLTAPAHYLACDGTEYNISDYPHLSQHFIDQFGSVNYFGGDGTTTFAVPDLRGEFLRGTGTALRNTGSGAAVGKHQDGTRHFNIGIVGTGIGVASRDLTSGGIRESLADRSIYPTKNMRVIKTDNTQEVSVDVNEQYTSRPTNTAVLYCIKYEPTYFMQNTYIGNEEVALWEGSVLINCSVDGTATGLDHTITLTDDMSNYDKIEIRYGACTLNNEIFSYPRVEQIIPSEVETVANYGDIAIGLHTTAYRFIASGYFKDNQTLVITTSKTENTAQTGLEALIIYRIVGYRTSLKTQEE